MKIRLLFLFISFCIVNVGRGQCPQVYDGNGIASSNPYWISCTGGAYTLNFSSPSAIGSYTVVWGDGTANTTGTSLNANTIITHNYASAIDTFVVSFITSAPSCTLTGVVVMEKPVNASIQIPVGGVTAACAPATLAFINSSTDVSQTTSFSWNFGDGTAPVNYNYTNDGQTVTHTYNKGTVNCETIVTLSAKNYCTFSMTTSAQFNPIQIYDIDQAAITPDATKKCFPDDSFTFTNTTNRNCFAQGNNGIRYEKWNFGNYWGTGHDSIINWTAWPPTFPKTVTYPGLGCYIVLLYDSNECGIDTANISVCIVSKPTAGLIVGTSTVCLGTAMTFTNTSSTGYLYQWDFGDNATYTNTNYNPQTHTYANAGTYTVTVVAYVAGATNSCKDTAHLVVTILPAPVSNFTFTPSIGCNTVTATFTDVSTGGAIGWQWNFGNGNTFTGQSPPAQTYTTGNYPVTLTVTSANGCTNAMTQTVPVYQKPIPQYTTTVGCATNMVQFTDQSTHAVGDNIITWSWGFGDGSPRNNTENPTHTYTTAATYSVVLSVATAHCSDSITVPLVINPLPIVSFTNVPTSGCPSLNITFTNTSTGATSYNWNFGNGNTSTNVNPTQTFSNSTTATIKYIVNLTGISSVGCKDSLKDTIQVFGKPIASFSSNAAAACAPYSVTFTNTTIAGVNYTWNFGDGTATSTLVNPAHLYQNTTNFLQNYTVTLHATNAGGCQDSTKQVVQSYPQAQFNFSSLPDSGCTQLHVNFPATAGAVSYQWDFGDGSPLNTGSSPTHTYTNTSVATQTFAVQLIAVNAFNCRDTANQTITVFPKPVAMFTVSKDSGCAPFAINFTNLSTNTTTYSWLFGDGSSSIAQNTAHTYTTSSTVIDSFLVKLISFNTHGCSDTAKKEVYVFPKVIANFTCDTIGCSPLNVSFINSTVGATTYTWNYGDGSPPVTTTHPTHVYTNTTTAVSSYTAQLFAENIYGCSGTLTQNITIFPKPIASFSLSANTGCSVFTPGITNNSTGAASTNWDFGDGGTSTLVSPVHSFTNTALTKDSFNVQLIVTNTFSCKDTATNYVYVLPKVNASFTCDTIGCSPLKSAFINSTQGGNSYTWSFGDTSLNSTATNPTHTYTNISGAIKTYTAQLIGNNSFNCSDTATQKITVLPKPSASFSLSATSGCTPFSPTFTNSSVGAASSSWSFGDGTTSALSTPTHTYVNTSFTSEDSFNIQLIIVNAFGCKDTAQKYTYTFPQIQAKFSADTPICAPVNVVFNNNTISTSVTTYTWNFGDGSPLVNTIEPSHTYNNITGNALFYTVTLNATNSFGCTSAHAHTYAIYPTPTALFSLNPGNTQTYPATTIGVNNNTANASSFNNHWNFGDGSTASVVSPPNHTYATWGTYTITLVVSSAYCKDSVTQVEVIIPPKPVASFTGCTAGCVPLVDSLHSTSQYATSYFWSFGDPLGGSASIANPIYPYTQPGTFNIKLVVTGPGGKDSITSNACAIVYPNPIATFTIEPTSAPVIVGVDALTAGSTSTITLIPTPESISTYSWNFGDGSPIITTKNASHIYQQPGQYAVTLIAASNHGCVDTSVYHPIVTTIEQFNLQVPNAFTPNPNGTSGDGIYDPASHDNDIFHPNISGLQTYELDIFDRWGELIFVSKDIRVGWDGYYKGKLCEQSVYVWKIRGTTIDGKNIDKAGDLTLLR
jgi:gliding motility-associated-like protein